MASSSRPARARYLSSIVPTSLIPEKSGNHSECSSYFCWGPKGLLRDGAGAVRPGVLRRGSALPAGGGPLAAPEGREHGAGQQVGAHQGAHPARRRAAEGVVRAGRPAEPDLAGAFYRGLRLVSLDGTTIL